MKRVMFDERSEATAVANAAVRQPTQPVPMGRPFWRRSDPVMADDGRTVQRGGMWPHQRRLYALPNFIKVLVGGYGAGKTIALCKRAIAATLANAPAPSALVSPTFPIARETTIVTTLELLEGKKRRLGKEVFDYEYNQTTHVFTIRHYRRTGRLLILTGERPERLKGPNLGWAGIDEPFMQKHEVFYQMIARVRHPMAAMLELVMTGTPEELNWGYDLCMGELDKNNEGESLYDVGVVFASTRANKALDPKYVKRLESVYDDKAVLAYVEGQFVSLNSGLVYYAFESAENVVHLPRTPGVELGVGMDFNVNPMAATVFWRSGSHMHFFDEIELPNADTEYMCAELHSRGYHREGLRKIYPDASGVQRHSNSPGGKTDFHYIRESGFEIDAPAANPPRKDRYNACNGKFKPREGKVTLTVEPSCRKLRKYLAQYSHEKMNKQQDMSHLLDAFGYPVHRLFPVSSNTARTLRLKGY